MQHRLLMIFARNFFNASIYSHGFDIFMATLYKNEYLKMSSMKFHNFFLKISRKLYSYFGFYSFRVTYGSSSDLDTL